MASYTYFLIRNDNVSHFVILRLRCAGAELVLATSSKWQESFLDSNILHKRRVGEASVSSGSSGPSSTCHDEAPCYCIDPWLCSFSVCKDVHCHECMPLHHLVGAVCVQSFTQPIDPRLSLGLRYGLKSVADIHANYHLDFHRLERSSQRSRSTDWVGSLSLMSHSYKGCSLSLVPDGKPLHSRLLVSLSQTIGRLAAFGVAATATSPLTRALTRALRVAAMAAYSVTRILGQ